MVEKVHVQPLALPNEQKVGVLGVQHSHGSVVTLEVAVLHQVADDIDVGRHGYRLAYDALGHTGHAGGHPGAFFAAFACDHFECEPHVGLDIAVDVVHGPRAQLFEHHIDFELVLGLA